MSCQSSAVGKGEKPLATHDSQLTTSRFITFEGGEGAGKSTQIKLLSEALTKAGIAHITTREPGGSVGAEAIRNLVVSGAVDAWDARTEALLFMAARLDHLETIIKPALARGEWVLCDRFYDSTTVYQGIAKGVGTVWLDQLYSLLFGNLTPDATLWLDISAEDGLARAAARGNDAESRFERMGLAYHQKIHAGFQSLALTHPQRILRIDAAQDINAIHRDISDVLNTRFGVALIVPSA